MRRSSLGLALLLAGLTLLGRQPPRAADDPQLARLVGEVLTRGTTVENLRTLTDTIGGRVSGSTAYDRAVSFALDRFAAYGYANARRDPFELPTSWLRGSERLGIVAPADEDIPVAQFGWTAPTPPGGLAAPIVDVGGGTEAEFGRAASRLSGAIALVHLDQLKGASVDAILAQAMSLPPMSDRARAAHAAALLVSSPRPENVLYVEPLTFGTIGPLPAGTIGHDQAARLQRTIAAGTPVKARLVLEGRVGPSVTSSNVVAELAGTAGPNGEIILIGAHLDSWDLGQGADDNGVNAMSVIEVARAFAAVQAHPSRTIRFVLFGGEEQGLFGSLGYVRAHRADLPRFGAVVIMDAGSGRTISFNLGARPDLVDSYRRVLAPVAGLGALGFTTDPFFGSDNFYFMLEGVPALFANQEMAQYVRHYHAATDTFDRIDAREALINSALFAEVTYALASAPGSLGTHATRETMLKALQDARVDHMLRIFGAWPPPSLH